MATEKEKRQFFANRKDIHIIHMSGKSVHFANFPKEDQVKIMTRLAERDEVMAQGLKGALPGIKIDGKVVTRDNIHEFEKGTKSKKKLIGKAVLGETIKEVKKPTKSELEKLSFKKLKVIGKKLGTTDRSKKNLIKEILKLQ